ncbi:glutamine synthetase family protein [Ferrimonas balearica]|uniref:glutamine synthetase family protein n=1 Tax=Ferrimonas balearica TaxID=44012 RepID=UPI001C99F37F|nr:glutamine synthetase family protein [Ferrimonas balearica]MBY5990818.1 glutamine synthetase family protein [Ferrimonas balearica]
MVKHLNLVAAQGSGPSPKQFLKAHPDLASIDLLLPDINGVFRGKRIQPEQLEKVFKDGVCLPASVFGLDITGETSEKTGLGFSTGDGDRRCALLHHTLSPAPWHKKPMAQALLTMLDNDGQPYPAEPRNVLAAMVARFAELGLTPCVAVELEFYLVDPEHDIDGMAQPPMGPDGQHRITATQCYSVDDLDHYSEFLDEVNAICRVQHIPASNAVAEYAPGQFEINLNHLPDPVTACDQAMQLKRVIRAVAQKHGHKATFMAKPHQTQCGSGMHIHVSLQDKQGNNRFAQEEALLKQAIAGLLEVMPASQLLFAPHANSYRRMQPDMFVPMAPTWGYDNRTVALRIPNGPASDTRIEHRVAGADANPYLVTAAILAGALHGMEQKLTPPAPVEGDANALELPLLPHRWHDALDCFRAPSALRQQLGETFCDIYASVKESEIQRFEQQITPLEMQWYQDTI